VSPRSSDQVRRTLCLTETCLVERDPATYNVVTCKPLCDVCFFSIISALCVCADFLSVSGVIFPYFYFILFFITFYLYIVFFVVYIP